MNRSHWIALVFAVVVSLWMASGIYGIGVATETADRPVTDTRVPRARVQTRLSAAMDIARSIKVQGHTTPAREVMLRAETTGTISRIDKAEGAAVATGDILMRLDLRDREARLREAQALVRQRELEFKASSRLQTQGMRSDSQQAEAVSQLESARRQLQSIEIEVANTRIRAPFAGVVDAQLVEIGEFVQSGDPLVQLLQLDPYLVVGQVSELEIGQISAGRPASARLINGETVNGKIRFVAARADAATRTFRVELEVPNPTRRRLFGMTAEIIVPLHTVRAHRASPAVLTLDGQGEVSIKGVDGDGRVTRWPVNIVKSDSDGFWLAGLPENAEIIVVGQDYVREGDAVEAVRAQ